MRLDWSTLALQLVNFAILVWLLQRFLYRPILRVVDARRAALAGKLADAAQAAERARRQLSDLQAQRAGLVGERAAALAKVEEESRQLVATRRAQAQREAEAVMEEARKTLAHERDRAQDEMRRAALVLASEMAQRALAEIPESLRVQAWLERIDSHLESLSPTELSELSGELAGGGTLRVVTAWPVGAQEQWRTKLRAALGSDITVTFETAPQLIGGAELHFPHARLTFSIQGAIAALQEEAWRHEPDR
ncbi:MAG TPA: hypothetical protein VFU61_07075 [Steroidobacteraceae bacterium]|jgi:F-type H+-transporting ATPase subunit b|nr:hypothetical protein [Steroidobacteraceae bacterium]